MIEKLVLNIDGVKIELTVEQAKELVADLNYLFSKLPENGYWNFVGGQPYCRTGTPMWTTCYNTAEAKL